MIMVEVDFGNNHLFTKPESTTVTLRALHSVPTTALHLSGKGGFSKSFSSCFLYLLNAKE
jgi:hypothetical protein